MITWICFVFVVMSPFAFLILLIWVFSVLILVRFDRGLSMLFILSKNQLFVSLILFIFCLFVSISLILAFTFIISLLLFVLGFACSCYSRSLRCCIRSLIWDLSDLLIYALMSINFPHMTAIAVSHRFQ
jgi:hypothetical protein